MVVEFKVIVEVTVLTGRSGLGNNVEFERTVSIIKLDQLSETEKEREWDKKRKCACGCEEENGA